MTRRVSATAFKGSHSAILWSRPAAAETSAALPTMMSPGPGHGLLSLCCRVVHGLQGLLHEQADEGLRSQGLEPLGKRRRGRVLLRWQQLEQQQQFLTAFVPATTTAAFVLEQQQQLEQHSNFNHRR